MFEVAGLLKKYREKEIIKFTRKEESVIAFMELLATHFKEKRKVQDYVTLLYVTPKHLNKTVKKVTNKTCSYWIDEMIINEAKILLEDLSASVASVADALNFCDQFYFSNFFKSHTGLNPSKYKSSI